MIVLGLVIVAPAEIDLMLNEDGKLVTKARGIYKLEGDELTMVISLEDDGRPKDFTPSDRVLIYVLKRK
jgi:uncharacterized protein (TIGR03067 family)